MIALPGLCLVTGRFAEARDIFAAFAEHISEGMIPNRFPDAGEEPEYHAVDATLWFFVALYKYLQYTEDYEFASELWPTLEDIEPLGTSAARAIRFGLIPTVCSRLGSRECN